QLRKPKKNGRGNSATRKIFDNLSHVSRTRIAFGWPDDEVAFAINVKVACAPVLNAVSFDCLFDRRGQIAVSLACPLERVLLATAVGLIARRAANCGYSRDGT